MQVSSGPPANVNNVHVNAVSQNFDKEQSVGICKVDGKNYLKVDGEAIRSLSDFQQTSLVYPQHFLDHPLVKKYLDSIKVDLRQDAAGTSFNILSWNVNLCVVRLEGDQGLAHKTHPHYRMDNRKVFVWLMLAEIVKLKNPDVICLQEIRDFEVEWGNPDTQRNFVKEFTLILDKLGYEVACEKEDRTSSSSFQLMTGHRKDSEHKFIQDQINPILVTQDGKSFAQELAKDATKEQKDDYFGAKRKHNFHETVAKSILETVCDKVGVKTHILNVHSGLNEAHKLEYGKKLGERMVEIRQQNPNARVIAIGDMNIFEEDKMQVISRVTEKGNIHNYQKWQHHNGDPVEFGKASTMTMDPFDWGYQPTKEGQEVVRLAEENIKSSVKGGALEEAKAKIWGQNSKAKTPATHPVSGDLDQVFSSGFDADRSGITIYNKPIVNSGLETSELTNPNKVRDAMKKADYGKLPLGLFGSWSVMNVVSSLFASDHHPVIARLMPYQLHTDKAADSYGSGSVISHDISYQKE